MEVLINEDCLDAMRFMPDKSVDMVLCDLPYEVLNKGNKNANWDKMIPLDKLWEQYNRIVKDNGAIVLFGQGMFTCQLMMSNPKHWRYNLVWDKRLPTGFLNAKRMPLRSHEDIVVFYKKLPTYNPQMEEGIPLHGKGSSYKSKKLKNNCYGDMGATDDTRCGCTQKYPKSILHFDKPHPSITVQATQKPVELLEYLIKTYSNEGDTILDNTMGSGSTGVACIRTHRNFIGIEKDENYFEIAKKRIQEESIKCKNSKQIDTV